MRWSGRARLPWITDSALVQLGQNATLSLWRSRVQIPYALLKEPYRNYIKLLFWVANFFGFLFFSLFNKTRWWRWVEACPLWVVISHKYLTIYFEILIYINTFRRIEIMITHTHMEFAIAFAGKPGYCRFWEQPGFNGVCMSSEGRK